MTQHYDHNDVYGETNDVSFDHGTIAATTTVKLKTVRRPSRCLFVEYKNVAGVTADATDFYTLQILNGSTVVASYSVQTGADGTIAADTFVLLTLSATDTNRIFAAGDVLAVKFLKAASAANLTTGRVNVVLESV